MPGKGKVVGGLLEEPIDIKTRGDVNRARVLPQVRAKRQTGSATAPSASSPTPAPAGESEQPKSGFDYVMKRNQMMRGVSTRARRRSSVRRA